MRKSKVMEKIRGGKEVRIAVLGHVLPAFLAHAAHSGYDCIGQHLGRNAFTLQAPGHDMRFADIMRLENHPPRMGLIVSVLCLMGKFAHGAQYIMVPKNWREKKKLAATYSPTPLPVQYHRR